MEERVKLHNMDAEKAVLGGLMKDSNAIYQIADYLTGSDFYFLANERIFSTMLELSRKNEPFDLLTLSGRLKDRNLIEEVGGYSYIASLTDFIPSTVEIRHYAKLVKEKAILRQIMNAAHEMNEKIERGEKEVDEILDFAQKRILDISEFRVERRYESLDSILGSCIGTVEDLRKSSAKYTGVVTGFEELDAKTHGFQPSDFIVIGARPSMGKSALALNMAINAARTGVPVGFFSLEMSKEQLGMRILSTETGIKLEALRSGRISKEKADELEEAAKRLMDLPLYIDDTPGLSIFELKIKARRLFHEHRIGMLIVDYLQMMRGEGRVESREREISEISRGLKNIAKELNIPVVALSQLNREVEKKADKRPTLADLRESGAIEQDADVVVFIFRKSVYQDDIPESEENLAELILAKQRNGPIGKVDLVFFNEITRFDNYSRIEEEELF